MDAQALDTLAVAAQGGDREAFRLLFLETQQDLRLFIAAHAASREQVDELLQATYVAAFEHLAQYRACQTLRGWLKGIARNRLVDEWRESRRLAALDGGAVDELMASETVDELEAAETAEEAAQITSRLAQCMDRLPERSRLLIERRYRDGLALAELARRFRRTTEALGVALFRVRQSLKRCLQEST